MEEIRVDTRIYDAESAADGMRSAELCFKINSTIKMHSGRPGPHRKECDDHV